MRKYEEWRCRHTSQTRNYNKVDKNSIKYKSQQRKFTILEEKNKLKKKNNKRSTAIPWSLLDELEGEKNKFETERAYQEIYKKF